MKHVISTGFLKIINNDNLQQSKHRGEHPVQAGKFSASLQ